MPIHRGARDGLTVGREASRIQRLRDLKLPKGGGDLHQHGVQCIVHASRRDGKEGCRPLLQRELDLLEA
jgi:hypothetical protein